MNQIAIIGSVAANLWEPDLWPTPKDVDFIVTWNYFQEILNRIGAAATPTSSKTFVSNIGGKFVEWEIAWPDSSGFEFLMQLEDAPVTDVLGIQCALPSLNDLFLLKTSHRYRKNFRHFEKTRKDWETLRNLGCEIVNDALLRKREKETYTAPRPSLAKSKSEFFRDEAGIYVYDHDTIHEAVAHLDRPAYLFYKKDGAEVQCDRQKWLSVSDGVRFFGVLEEVYVLALERSQIPFPDTDRLLSFKIALEKVCTSITSGFFREYAYENYYRVFSAYQPDYVNRFNDALSQGKIRKFKS